MVGCLILRNVAIEEILWKYPKYYPIPKFVYVAFSIAVIHRFHDTYVSEKAKPSYLF